MSDYYCYVCGYKHHENSKIGREHAEFKSERKEVKEMKEEDKLTPFFGITVTVNKEMLSEFLELFFDYLENDEDD